ncbi:hypothetical protein [Tritonibacter mobilis]|uniref:hypothetical protein n=1 Tax=Tritonibacter mobilis TaxID=379347 RepID=UPI001403FB20|nr:hypothetical protein [Tritonibacter mobilis]NHM18854.1 hypothetical protein [Tritonibacter mobilis]NHM22950.1 hypothetical protein [Tritonibacter mobilis]
MKNLDEVRKLLEEEVHKAFPNELITKIHVEHVELDADAGEIKITLNVSTSVDPQTFAEGYFGLTGKVRRWLAANEEDRLGKFFPIITPQIGHEVHA